MRYTLLSLLLLCQFVWCGEATPTPPVLLPATQKALDTYDTKLRAEKQKYLAAALKIQQECQRALTAEQTALTKKGDLNGALAVKAKLDELQKQMVIEDPLFELLPPGTYEKFVDKSSIENDLLQYNWAVGEFVFTFNKDMTWSHSKGNSGTYTIKENLVSITYSKSSLVQVFQWSPKSLVMIQQEGKAVNTPLTLVEKK